jgi:hypothetical protein
MGGSSKVTTGFNYFGSIAQVVCCGPVDVLHEIKNGDTVIWTGPIYRSSAMDGQGKTDLTTTIGAVRFYWGTTGQTVDPLLASILINQGLGPVTAPMPSYAGLAYAVCEDVAFGTQTTPPTLLFLVSRFPSVLPLTGRVTRIAVTAGGTGYGSPPSVILTGGGGTGASATAVLTAGVVTSIVVNTQGTGYTSAPAVTFGSGAAAATAYVFHEINGDAILPEVIYDWLTNTLYGMGLDPAHLNQADFIAACNTVVGEGVGASPVFDSVQTVREVIGKLLPYVDAAPRFVAGQIGLTLIRKEDTTGLPHLGDDDFTDEPYPVNRGYSETWNSTRLVFTDRANKFEEGVEPYDHAANAAVVGQSVDRQVNYPFITDREVAKIVAKRVGIKAGKPPFVFTVKLLPKWETLQPGGRVFVTSAKLGITDRLCRVTERQIGGPIKPDVELTLVLEETRDESNDYVPPPDFFLTPAFLDQSGTSAFAIPAAQPRLLVLPTGLREDDGFLCAVAKPEPTARSLKVWWTWDSTVQAYRQIMLRDSFPIYGQIVTWTRIAPDRAILRVRFDVDNAEQMAVSAEDEFDLIGVTGQRRVSPSANTHSVPGLWFHKAEGGYFAQPATRTFDIEVELAAYDSDALDYQRGATAGRYPTDAIYFGKEEDFAIYNGEGKDPRTLHFEQPYGNSRQDTDQKRRVKVTTSNHFQFKDLSSATEVWFDRNDTTMDASGTYSVEWGVKALTMAEWAEVLLGQLVEGPGLSLAADLDLALGAVYDGTATANQTLLVDGFNLVLGQMIETNSLTYTDTP